MTFGFIRALFVLVSTIVGYQLGTAMAGSGSAGAALGTATGLGLSILIILLELALGKISMRGLSAAVFGLVLALLVSKLILGAIDMVPDLNSFARSSIKLVIVMVLAYFGMIFAMRGRDEFNLIIPYVKFERQNQRDDVLILDTSVIIDGRVFDVARVRFLEGHFVVPRFVLKELQKVADSDDALKRNRGRRGLDILNKMTKTSNVNIRIHEEDFDGIHSVDEKLVKLAKLLGGKVVTNDFNLNKVAELQGVSILNVNELAQALRPVLLPGESLEIRLAKEGKEKNQAIGYLDDGTMVVVDNAKHLVGQTVTVHVSTALQTAAGRMIFAKLEETKA